jgi:DNA end-binding protein Ku
MKLTRQLVDTLADEWKPEEFRDTYTEALRRVIEARIEGEEVVAPEAPRRARVVDLMEALKQSLAEQPRRLAKAPARRAAARSRTAARGRRRAA